MQRRISKRDEDGGYGIGWAISPDRMGVRTVGHTGGMGGVRTSLLLVPSEKVVVVVLANSHTSLPRRVTDDILAALLPESGRKPGPGPGPTASRRPAATGSAAITSGRTNLPQKIRGVWEGHLETYRQRLPLKLWLRRTGEHESELAGQPPRPLHRVSFRDGYLKARIEGDIGTEDAGRRRYVLELSLKRRGAVLNGAITAISMPGPRLSNALTSWVELRRQDP